MRKQHLTMFVSLLVLVAGASAQTPSQLDRVNVVQGADNIRVEMSSKGQVAPKLSTLNSPARVVVDLPGTVMATGQKNIAVGAAWSQRCPHRLRCPGDAVSSSIWKRLAPTI